MRSCVLRFRARVAAPTLPRLAHALLLTLCVALAGCVDVASPPPTADGAAEPTGPEPTVAAAADPDAGRHAHDYWAGRERVTLVDEDVVIEPFDVVASGIITTRIFRDPSFGGAFVTLPEGTLVYEGTGRVEVVATWNDPTIRGLRFLHRHAGSGELSPWLDAIGGEAVPIEVTPEMTDMPHAQESRWGFLFTASGAPPLAVGTFHLRIDIVKTRDVTDWPAHPDHWKGRSEITLVDAEGSSSLRVGPPLLENPWTEHEDAIPSNAPVPMEATTLRVTVTVLAAQDPQAIRSVHLLVRTAADVLFDYDDAGEPTQVSDDGLTWTWEVPIEMDQTDNPYARSSAWAFRVRAGPAAAPPVPFCEHGCYQSEIQYRLTATARREPR